MGFKSMAEYTDEKFGNWFRLQNDGDYADVIFLYRGTSDVMMADTHYIKADGYSGYVTCCGKGCPACAKQIRVQPKLFIPLYVVDVSDPNSACNRIQFWDRTMRFQPQLLNDVLRSYPNPADFVFRITRHGAAGDINTTYDIRAIMNNSNPDTSYDAICSRFGVVFPDYYNTICKDVDKFELGNMMTTSNPGTGYSGNNYGSGGYNAVPRGGASGGTIPGTSIPYSSGPARGTPNVAINASVPEIPPDPNDLPFSGSEPSIPSGLPSSSLVGDPLETNEDIDTTNLTF